MALFKLIQTIFDLNLIFDPSSIMLNYFRRMIKEGKLRAQIKFKKISRLQRIEVGLNIAKS